MVGPRAVIRAYPRGAKVDRARVTAGLPLIARRIFQAFQNRTDIVDMPDRAVADRREIVGEIDQPDDPPVRPRMRGRVHGRAQRYTAGNVFVTVNTDNAAHTLQINQLNTLLIATSDTDNARPWRVTRYGLQPRTATRGRWVVGIGRIKRPPTELALRGQGTPSPQLCARAGRASASQSQKRAGQCQAAGDPEQRCPAA